MLDGTGQLEIIRTRNTGQTSGPGSELDAGEPIAASGALMEEKEPEHEF